MVWVGAVFFLTCMELGDFLSFYERVDLRTCIDYVCSSNEGFFEISLLFGIYTRSTRSSLQ